MTNYTTEVVPTTIAPDGGQTSAVEGYIACAVAVLFFGSNFVPVKKFKTGDGMFFQWVLCSGIWLVGLIVNCVRDFPVFYPLAMVGGLLWTTGNLFAVPIIHMIGLSQGLLVWSSANLVVGWASGRFGWFGLDKEIPPRIAMNYIGMALCFCSAFLYTLIKSDVSSTGPPDELPSDNEPDERSALLNDTPRRNSPSYTEVAPINDRPDTVDTTPEDSDSEIDFASKMSPNSKRLFGLSLALLSGVFYGLNFAPVIYIQDNYVQNNVTASHNGLDYVFAHYTGIYTASTVYFMLYCAILKNRPRLYPRAILPALLSGVMWGIASTAWFVANAALSESVSFPIISSGPGMVGAIWGVFLFKEITGKRNLLILAAAFSITITGSVLTGFSHV